MRFRSAVVLCLISGVAGAAIDHNWEQLSLLADFYWNKLRTFAGVNALQTEEYTTSPSSLGEVEVLGNRVRCDNRYQELKIPESEYRAFFDQCMGNMGSTKER
jgi:hypothetical protein